MAEQNYGVDRAVVVVDGLPVPLVGLFGIKNIKWGARHVRPTDDESHIERGEN